MKRNVQSEMHCFLMYYYYTNHVCHPPGVKQVHSLVQSLQQCAKDAGHRQPLMIGIDQENGAILGVSSIRSKSSPMEKHALYPRSAQHTTLKLERSCGLCTFLIRCSTCLLLCCRAVKIAATGNTELAKD